MIPDAAHRRSDKFKLGRSLISVPFYSVWGRLKTAVSRYTRGPRVGVDGPCQAAPTDKEQTRSTPQHRAGAADGLDPSAKPSCFAAGLSRQADAVKRAPATAAQNGAEHERVHVSDHA